MTHPSFDDVHRSVTVPAPLPQVRWEETTAAPSGRPDRRWAWPAVAVAGLILVCTLLAALLLQGRGEAAATRTAVAADPAKAERVVPDTGWQDVSLVGGWVATGDGARYRVRDGVCYLQLHVTLAGGVWARNTPMAKLPSSAWPEWHMGFVGVRDGLPFGEVKVFDDGRVFVVAPSSATGGDITVSAAFPVGR